MKEDFTELVEYLDEKFGKVAEDFKELKDNFNLLQNFFIYFNHNFSDFIITGSEEKVKNPFLFYPSEAGSTLNSFWKMSNENRTTGSEITAF